MEAVRYLQEIGHWYANKDKSPAEIVAKARELKEFYI